MTEYEKARAVYEREVERLRERQRAHEREAALIKEAEARLDGMRFIVESINPTNEPEEDSLEPSGRRMRMGTKKRAIYQAVANGWGESALLEGLLSAAEVEPRYVRDVLRGAVDAQDMRDDGGKYSLTESGAELLAKAPIPRDWSKYDAILGGIPDTSEPAVSPAIPEPGIKEPFGEP